MGKSIVVLLIALAIFFAGCSQEQMLDVSLRSAINLAINSAVADNEDAARVVEHMQARISFEMISTKTTNKGVDALYRVSSPDLTAFVEDFDVNNYATQEEMVEAIINAIEAAPITEKEVTVGFQNGVPVEYEDFLYAYSGGSYGLIAGMQGGNNGEPTEPSATYPNRPTEPPMVEGDDFVDVPFDDKNEETNGSKGLAYALNEDGKSCCVTGIGTCKDTKIVIPETYCGKPVTVIGEDAFAFNNTITEVVLSDNIQKMEGGAFRKCQSLKTLHIGSGYVEHYYYAIYDCRSLKNVYVSDENPVFKSVDGNILSKDGKAFWYYAIGKSDSSFTIPEGVTQIMHDAFLCGWQLKEITIPDYVTSIGAYAFRDCTSLKGIVVPEGVTSLGQSTFRGCTSLKDVTLPESLVELGNYVFSECESLKELVIPNNVQKMGAICWTNSSLKTVYLPATIDGLKMSVFRDCIKLKDVYFGGTVAQWEALPKAENWNLNANAFTVHCTDGNVSVEQVTMEPVDVSIPFDKIVIKYVAEEKYIIGTPYLRTMPSGIIRKELCLSKDKMKAVAFTVIKNKDGTFSFKTDNGKFLLCNVNEISFASKESEYTKFVLIPVNNGYRIMCYAAKYNGNPQYLEYWLGNLTCYSLNANNADIFVFDFEDAGEAAGTVE